MNNIDTSAEAVERLAKRIKRDIDWRPGSLCAETAATLRALLAERDRLAAEVASLRLTLGGKTFSNDVPEPIGCPVPGACATVAEIVRLREVLALISDAAPDGWHLNGVFVGQEARAALAGEGRGDG